MKIRCNQNEESGTSLAEVSIAVAILAVMAGVLISAFNYGFFAMQWARENQRATQIILEKVETLRLYRWDQVNSNGFIPQGVTEYYDPQMTGAQGVGYRCELAISPVPFTSVSGYHTNMRQLTVTLTWTNTARQIPRTRQLSTFIAKDGLQDYVY